MVTLGALLTGCSESEEPAAEESSVAAAELKPIDAETRALLKVPASVEVVGALPWVPAKAEPLDRAVLGDGSGVRYDWSDAFYTGIFGRAGDVVNQLGFHGQSGDTPVAGGDGGSAEDIRCSEGKRLVGLAGAVSSNVNRLAPVCATPTTNGVTNQYMGGSSGTSFNYRCPLDTWVIGFSVVAGEQVNGLTLYCGK